MLEWYLKIAPHIQPTDEENEAAKAEFRRQYGLSEPVAENRQERWSRWQKLAAALDTQAAADQQTAACTMRVILDTNVLLQALAAYNPLRSVFNAFILEKFQLVVSTEILLEYEELLLRKHPLPIAADLYNLITEAPNIVFQRVACQLAHSLR